MYGSLSRLPQLQHSLYNLLQLCVLSMCSTQDVQLNWLTMALIMAFTECEWVYANIQWSEDTHPVLHSFAMPSHPRPSLVGQEQQVQETCTAHHGQCYWNQWDHMPPRSEGQVTNMFFCCKFLSKFLWKCFILGVQYGETEWSPGSVSKPPMDDLIGIGVYNLSTMGSLFWNGNLNSYVRPHCSV